jgi:hypothetical protein
VTSVVRLAAARLQISFERRQDRFCHAIEVLNEVGTLEPWLASIEGTEHQLWPASPVLQTLHVEDRGGGAQVALLVGMAGRSHWSMSVEVHREREELLFDVACRTRENPEFLGSTYDVVEQRLTTRQTAGQLQLARGDNWLELDGGGAPGASTLDWSSTGRITIVASADPVSGPTTHRWRYSFHRAFQSR